MVECNVLNRVQLTTIERYNKVKLERREWISEIKAKASWTAGTNGRILLTESIGWACKSDIEFYNMTFDFSFF